MADFAEIAHNLLTLEINTVLKPGMSAQKMPGYADALIDLSQEYHEFLCLRARQFGALGRPLDEWAAVLSDSFTWGLQPFPMGANHLRKPPPDPANPLPAEQTPPGRFDPDLLKDTRQQTSTEYLDQLREAARWLIEMRDRVRAAVHRREFRLTPDQRSQTEAALEAMQPTDDAVLSRIMRNLDQLKALPGKLKPAPGDGIVRRRWEAKLEPEDAVILRKAWDVGVELVVMQTVVQLDGDVVSRIDPTIGGPANATLHDLHGEAVSIAFRHWQFLAATVARFAGMAISSLLRRP